MSCFPKTISFFFKDKEVIAICKTNALLSYVLKVYQQLESSTHEHMQVYINEADNLAIQGRDLLADLKLTYKRDVKALRREILVITQKNHPDKIKENNEIAKSIMVMANQLLDLIKNNVFDIYLERLQIYKSYKPLI